MFKQAVEHFFTRFHPGRLLQLIQMKTVATSSPDLRTPHRTLVEFDMKSGAVRMNGGVPGGVAAKTTTARSSGLEKTVSSSPVARGNRFPMGPAKPKAPVLGGSASKSAPVLGGSATKSGGLQIRATGTARPAATPNVGKQLAASKSGLQIRATGTARPPPTSNVSKQLLTSAVTDLCHKACGATLSLFWLGYGLWPLERALQARHASQGGEPRAHRAVSLGVWHAHACIILPCQLPAGVGQGEREGAGIAGQARLPRRCAQTIHAARQGAVSK